MLGSGYMAGFDVGDAVNEAVVLVLFIEFRIDEKSKLQPDNNIDIKNNMYKALLFKYIDAPYFIHIIYI